MHKQVVGLLGLATRANKISTGDMAIASLRSKEAKLIVLAYDIGENTKKKLFDKCKYYQIPIVFMDGDLMNQAIGASNRKFIAILDEGFAQKLSACLKG